MKPINIRRVEGKMQEKIGYKEIIKQKEFMKTVIAALINRFGDSIDSIAFTWLVYQITKSAAWSAIIFGVNRIPTIFLQPLAGAAVEGKNKKQIMIVTDIIRGICVGLIATANSIGILNPWMMLASTVIISCAEAFRLPASAA
jgi:MFS family permease